MSEHSTVSGGPPYEGADAADLAEQDRPLVAESEPVEDQPSLGWESDPADVAEQQREIGWAREDEAPS
jgi:hypothetical protein